VWIGFDGLGTSGIPEQVGTNALCYNGSPYYQAWEEDPSLASPGAQQVFQEISAGDQITASITYLGNNRFQLKIADAHTGDSRTFNVIFSKAPRVSAEWIVEDPWYTRTNDYLPLPTPFQPVTFTDCSAAVNNTRGQSLNSMPKH
jgi:hypothetical protein